MPILQVIREVQIPLVAVMLLAGCLTKLHQLRRTGSLESGVGPTALFPLSLRKPLAIAMCVAEAALGLGLIVTACGTAVTGGPATATIARLGAGLLFLVATSTLIELRTVRPDVGCGCFGEYSTAPVSGRTIARSALLAGAIISTLGLRAKPEVPHTAADGLELLAIVCAELLLIGFLSPEVGAGLIRLGYSEPCELRRVPSTRTLIALRRSKQWRRYAGLITSDVPTDMWRELCWRYVAYPSIHEGRPADLVFAVFLQYRRPVVHAALVDAATGLPLALPTGKGRARPVPPPPSPAPPPPLPLAEANGAHEADDGATADELTTADAVGGPGRPGALAAVGAPVAAAVAGAVAGGVAVADEIVAADASAATSRAAAARDAELAERLVAAPAVGEVAAPDDPDATLVDLVRRPP